MFAKLIEPEKKGGNSEVQVLFCIGYGGVPVGSPCFYGFYPV